MAGEILQGGVGFGRGFLTLAYFLVPGYVGYKTYLHYRSKEDDYRRFDKLLYTVGFGLTSFLIFATLYRLNLGAYLPYLGGPEMTEEWLIFSAYFFSPWGATLIGYSTFPGIEEIALRFSWEVFYNRGISLDTLGETDVAPFILGIACQSAVGSGIGALVGRIQRQEDTDINQPWDTMMEEHGIGDQVRVTTESGDTIEGKLLQYGSRLDNNNILIENPHIIEEGRYIPAREWTGANPEDNAVAPEQVYSTSSMLRDDMHFSHDSISRLQFVPKHISAPPPDEEPADEEDPGNDGSKQATSDDRGATADDSSQSTDEESPPASNEEPFQVADVDDEENEGK